MFIIRNKQEFRDHLQFLKTNQIAAFKNCKTKKDQHFYRGILMGIQLALDGLNDWDEQDKTLPNST